MQQKYQLKDASNIYILAILVPLIVSFALSFVLSFAAIAMNIEVNQLLSNIYVYSIILLITQGSFLAVVLFYNKKRKISFTATTINKKVGIVNYLIVGVISISSLFLFLPIVNMFDAIIRNIGYSNSGDLPFAINSIPRLLIALFSLALLPAVCEEIVFRGVIFNGLKNKLGVKKGVLLSALCFCIMHMSLQQTIYPLLLGVVLALILHFTGSVRATIFAHFCNNAIVVISNYIASFNSSEEVAEPFVLNFANISLAIAMLIIGALVVAGGCLLIKKLKKQKVEEFVSTDIEQSSYEIDLDNEQKKISDKVEIRMFCIFIAISIVMWIIENILYFVG